MRGCYFWSSYELGDGIHAVSILVHSKAEFRAISKFSSRKTHKNDIQGEFPVFYEFTLYKIFHDFPKNDHFESKFSIMAILLKNLRKHL